MTPRSKESMRKRVLRMFNRANERWTFNGQAFESKVWYSVYGITVDVKFTSKLEEIVVQVWIGRVNYEYVGLDCTDMAFTGRDCYISAIEALTDYITDLNERLLENYQEIEDCRRVGTETLCSILQNLIPAYQLTAGNREAI